MANLFIQEEEKSLDSEVASTDIDAGAPVFRESGGGAHELDVVNDTTYHGVAVHVRNSPYAAENSEDYGTYDSLYTWPNGERMSLQPRASSSVLMFWSVEDDTQPEPTISKNDKAVFVDLGNGPKVVEDGYTDSGGTTYGPSAGTGDYVLAGKFDQELNVNEAAYDKRIPIRLAPEMDI